MSASSRIYRQTMLAACSTCGAEWFGPGAETLARRHGSDTGHQVELQVLIRETVNAVSEMGEPNYAPPVKLSAEEIRMSVDAARARATLFEQPVGRRRPW